MAIYGIILIVIAVFLTVGFFSNKKKLAALQSAKASTVEFLESLKTSMSEGVGDGSLSYIADIKGKIICDEPLKSELAGVDCVYYSMRIERKYEETYYQTDDKGNQHRRTRSSSETLASNDRYVPFFVQDNTGKIMVDPADAEFIADKVLSKFEPATAARGGVLSFGGFSIEIPMMHDGDRRTTGYSFEEYAIPVGRNIYVNGEATDRGGELCIVSPGEKSKFIVSIKSKEALLRDVGSSMMWMKIGAILCGIGGTVMAIMGLLQK